MTNDEIAERIKYVTMDEGDGVPGAQFAREMAEEVLQLRAELARLQPLAEAAVAFYCNDGSPDTADTLNETACTFGADWISARARAQAQAGEGA